MVILEIYCSRSTGCVYVGSSGQMNLVKRPDHVFDNHLLKIVVKFAAHLEALNMADVLSNEAV